MKLIKNYLWNATYQIFILIIPFITIPYTSRVLGPGGIGINSYTNSIAQYFILFGSIGVALYGNRQIAFVKDDKDELSNTFWGIFTMKFITVSLALIIYLICTIFIWKSYRLFFIGQAIQIFAAAIDISWFFIGMENFRVTVTRNVLVKVISIFCIFTFIHNKGDTGLFIILNGLSLMLGNVTLFPYLHRYIGYPVLKKINIFKHLLPSLVLFIPQIAVQLYVVINKTMLGAIISVDASGFYDNADKIIRLMLAITTAVGTVMLPHIANQFINGEHEKIKKTVYISFDFVTFITVPLAFGLASVSYKFTILFFGNNFRSVGILLFIESFASIFMSWAYAIGTQYLLPTKQTNKYTLSVSMGAMVNIILCLPMIYIYGAIGAMISTIVAEICVTISILFFIRKQLEIRKMFINTPKYLLSSTVMFLCVYYINHITKINWISLVMQVVIGIIIYIIMIIFLKPTILIEAKKIFNKK